MKKRKTFLRNKENARNARTLFIDELAAIQAENGKTTEEARLKSMLYIEKKDCHQDALNSWKVSQEVVELDQL